MSNTKPKQPVNLRYERAALHILDQTVLPHELRFVVARDLATVAEAIRVLRVRGAPAIGIAAAYGVAVALADHMRQAPDADLATARAILAQARETLAATRPTAVNLVNALDRMARIEEAFCDSEADADPTGLLNAIEASAIALHEEEAELCERIAAAGLSVLPEEASILTHCNAGPLATGGIGTALGVVIRGHQQGRRFEVFADETRPLLQGARLTTWELEQAGVPHRLLPDGAAASLILSGRIDATIVGADRIACNGDTANKIGTLPVALAAKYAGVPFYVAAPASSFDFNAASGAAIPIEMRADDEVNSFAGKRVAPEDTRVHNPAFDVTPGGLVSAFFTEHGVLRPPYDFSTTSR